MVELVAGQWWLFPAAALIATLAMSSGIGGAILFSPLFMVVLELPPAVAIGTALLTQLFGFGSGVFAYRRLRLIDYALARRLMMVAVPGAAIGVLCAGLVSGDLLRRIFACGILVIGVQLFRSYHRERRRDTDASQAPAGPPTLVDARGILYHYSVRRPLLARVFGAGGGTLLGLISVGLAELLEYHLIVISRVPPVAVGTSIFVVLAATLTATVGHLYAFAVYAAPGTLAEVGQVVLFTIPGVLLGGQIGPWLQTRLDPTVVRLGMAVVFCTLGVFMLV